MTNSDTTYGVHNKQTKEIKIHAKLDDSVVVQSFSGNVETAKAAILTADALANNNTNATQLDYAITADGNGLKFTIAFGTKGSGTAESDDWADTWTTTKASLIAAKNYVKGIQSTFTSSTLSTDSTSKETCTVTTTSPHGLSVDDKVTLSSVTLPGGTGLSEVDFEGLNFIVGTVPTDVTFTIASNGQASSIVSTGGSMTVEDKYWTATAVTPHLF